MFIRAEKVICEDIEGEKKVIVEKGKMYYVYTEEATMLLQFESFICGVMEFQIPGDAFCEDYFAEGKIIGIKADEIEAIRETKEVRP